MTGSSSRTTPEKFLQAGDVIQTFPCRNPSENTLLGELLTNAQEDVYFFHVCFGAYAYESLNSAGLILSDEFFHIPLKSHLDKWMPSLIDELKNTSQEDLAEVFLSLQKFVIHLHRPLIRVTSNNGKMVAAAKQLLFDACLTDVSLPEVASSLGYGYETFRKIFKEETGLSPLQYVLDSRFHYAQRLLTEGMTVKETAATVGYADPYIFSKQFKKYIGQSPSAYKK